VIDLVRANCKRAHAPIAALLTLAFACGTSSAASLAARHGPRADAREGRLPKGFTVLYSFAGAPDGASPLGGLSVDGNGNLFGTTFVGGANDLGTVFELAPAGSGFVETVLHSFTGSDGSNPVDNPLLGSDGTIFATALAGGSYGGGTALALAQSGSGYLESALTSFGSGSSAASPNAGLVAVGDTLYTTTSSGGKYGAGAILALNENGLAATDVYDFGNKKDGAYPLANLIADSNGTLYGTTIAGGTAAAGTIFRFVPSQSGGTEKVIWDFEADGPTDGASPNDGLAIDAAGDIYGTTAGGGDYGYGTVFKLHATGKKWAETILHSFGGGADGSVPIAGLTLVGKALYGSTSSGAGSACVGCGTLFRIKSTGAGYEVLHSFMGNDGANPLGAMVLSGSALYGTAASGGANQVGVVFRFVP